MSAAAGVWTPERAANYAHLGGSVAIALKIADTYPDYELAVSGDELTRLGDKRTRK